MYPEYSKKINSVLKKGGHFYIGDLEKEDGSFHGDSADAEHFGFEEKQMAAFFTACGLSIVAREQYHTIKRPDQSGEIREYPLFFYATEKL